MLQHKVSPVPKQREISQEVEKTHRPRVPRDLPPQNHLERTCYPSPVPEHFHLTQSGFTLEHGRRNRPTDAQSLVLPERLTEVLQHGRAQALATVSPPDKHGVKDREQVARPRAVTTQAACGERKSRALSQACTETRDAVGLLHSRVIGTTWKKDSCHQEKNSRSSQMSSSPADGAAHVSLITGSAATRLLYPDEKQTRVNA